MEKDFKKLKFDLLAYRHIYSIYVILIGVSIYFAIVNFNKGVETWFVVFEAAVILFLIWIGVFSLPKERNAIKTKSDISLLTLMSLKDAMKTRITSLMVLENEFDVLKEKDDGLKLIQDRIANIHIATIDKGIETAIKLGGQPDSVLITQFSVPASFKELFKLIQDMKKAAEHDQNDITMKIKKIQTLYEKF
jgi:hypothetical protein